MQKDETIAHASTPHSHDALANDLEKNKLATHLEHGHKAGVRSCQFIGRVGGNQEFIASRHDPANAALLAKEPDAAPGMTLREQMSLRPFTTLAIWKAALIEGFATLMLTFLTLWANISPNTIPVTPDAQLGVFDNASFLGPTMGGISNFLLLSLFTFAFGAVSGAHLNPSITFATFTTGLCSLPRAVLYISFQVAGAALGGLLVRAGWGGRDFKCGGCWLFDDVYAVHSAFTVEFVATTALLFAAFGTGLDPRQRKVIPPSLAPFLVGLTLGTLSWMTGYSVYGYGGASMSPSRCFGAYVGSYFPTWHWYQWVAPFCACLCHALFHAISPPGVPAS